MPKAGFSQTDQYEPKVGFQEGWATVIGAKTQVFQYPPNKETGDQLSPFLAAVLTFQKTDEQGHATEDEPQEKAFRIHKDLSQMRPGQATGRDDDDPTDLGDELDTEGNCIYTDGAKINVNSAYGTFLRSLETAGVPPAILHAGYMPDLVGLKGHFVTQKGEKRSIGGRDVEPAYLIVDKITTLPGSVSGKKPAAKATAASNKAASKANGVPAVPVNGKPAAAAAAASSDQADELATSLLIELASDLTGETRDLKKLYAMAYSRLVKNKDRDRALDKDVQDLLRNEEWLTAKGAEVGLWSFDNGVFTFEAAA